MLMSNFTLNKLSKIKGLSLGLTQKDREDEPAFVATLVRQALAGRDGAPITTPFIALLQIIHVSRQSHRCTTRAHALTTLTSLNDISG